MTPSKKQRVLVVDDDDAGRYATGRILRQAGFEVGEAGTGRAALRFAAEERPDLVLLDVRLPDIPGIEVCRRLKSQAETSSILVLQMTASAVDDGSRAMALENGADGFITSPLEPAALVATVRSLLRIRAAELAVQEAASEWQATFDAIRDGVALLDGQGVVLRSNAALPELLGLHADEIAGRSLDQLIAPGAEEPPLAETLGRLHRANSERMLGERTFGLTIDPRPGGGVAILTDVSEQKRLDRQLQHSQKLESIGLLAGGVAHDFNNLLVGILGNASLALEVLDDSETTRQLLQGVVGAAERAAELTRQLLAYAGKGRIFTAPVDLSTLVQELTPLIQSSIPRKVQLTLDLKAGLPDVLADKTQIEQLAMNLIINAGESIENEAGLVRVSTDLRYFSLEELGPFLTDNKTAGDFVVLQVSDTGSGMDADTVKRIFDPFFSTKFMGRGLGLSAALGIIRGHKGALRVSSTPGQGTVFEVLFPVSPTAAVLPRIEAPAAVETASSAILVVDDEEIVRSLMDHALTRAGYEVLLAGNGAEALSLFARNVKKISLVLLDLVMPVMSGEEVLPHLFTMKPGVPVIVSSAHSEAECRGKLREPRVAGFLQKPYTAISLAEKVQSVLGVAAV